MDRHKGLAVMPLTSEGTMRFRNVRTVPSMVIRICLIVCCSLMIVLSAEADQNSRLLNLLAEYEDTKEDLLVELANADRARKQGRKSDIQSIQQLSTESLQLFHDANLLYGEGKFNAQHFSARANDLPTLYALKVACDALYQTSSSELEFESLQTSAFLLSIRAKYEELLRMADSELKRAIAQQNFSAPSRGKNERH